MRWALLEAKGRDQDCLDPGYCDHKLWMAFKRAGSVTIMPHFKADLDFVFETKNEEVHSTCS